MLEVPVRRIGQRWGATRAPGRPRMVGRVVPRHRPPQPTICARSDKPNGAEPRLPNTARERGWSVDWSGDHSLSKTPLL